MSEKAKQAIALGIKEGTKIGDLLCHSNRVFGDVVAVWDVEGNCEVFTKVSIQKPKPSPYKINRKAIKNVILPSDHRILIFQTDDEFFVRDYDNKPIEHSEHWADFYSEPHNGNFFRQDSYGHWYDIEGYRLDTPVFLQEDVLISLPGKTSKRSLSFKGKLLIISPLCTLIQIGRLVLDIHLNRVLYYGDKITGLGRKNIIFAGGKRVQEVFLGLQRTAFIYEDSKTPFLVNEEPMLRHLASIEKGRYCFEVFHAAEREYVVERSAAAAFTCDEEPVRIDFNKYFQIGEQELMYCHRHHHSHYMDINHRCSFVLPEICDTPVKFVEKEAQIINGHRLRNMKTAKRQFVYDETQNKVFTLNEKTIVPNEINDPEHYSLHYGIATIGNIKKLFYKKNNTIVQLPGEDIEIQEILSGGGQKLLNVRSTTGLEFVLDARKGYDRLKRAYANDQAVSKVFGFPMALGSVVLQNALLETLGGTEKRVLNLNKEELPVFTLPNDLRSYPEDTAPSVFQNNPIIELDFDKPLEFNEDTFYSGTFLPFYDTPTPILLQEVNARPLHLEGGGHRNELILSFKIESLTTPYFLDDHRMVGAITLTEDGNENEILFSFNEKKSWLPFKDGFLPIFKRIVPLQNAAEWSYVFFELRRISSNTEYIVVERVAPYRILVEKKRRKEVPKVIHTTERHLKAPEELSMLKKIFIDDPGYLRGL